MTAAEAIAKFCGLLTLFVTTGAHGYDPDASITGLYTGPYFDPLAERNFTAHLEDRAVLPCTVRQLGDKSVSWVRMRDADILTVDRYTFVGDERFESHYSAASETWNLVIKYVQERDAGLYECQVSTEPKMSQLFSLRVVIPKVAIIPPGDRYVKAGSLVRVDCQITDVVLAPDYIFWYHEEKRVMDHLDENIVVTVKEEGTEALRSTLVIHKVPPSGSGNYTCMPSNLHAASVVLHVLNEKHPAAMQGKGNGSIWRAESHPHLLLLLLLIVFLCRASFLDFNEGNTQVMTSGKQQRPCDRAPSFSDKETLLLSCPPLSNSFSSNSYSSHSLPSSFSSSLDQAAMKRILKALEGDAPMAEDELKQDLIRFQEFLKRVASRKVHSPDEGLPVVYYWPSGLLERLSRVLDIQPSASVEGVETDCGMTTIQHLNHTSSRVPAKISSIGPIDYDRDMEETLVEEQFFTPSRVMFRGHYSDFRRRASLSVHR